MIRVTETVKHLLIINVLMFIVFSFMFQQFSHWLALYFPTSSMFRPYQIVSHMFMHGGLMHLFFNLFALWMFGSAVEMVWGGKKFLSYYIITGLGAAALHIGVKYISYTNLLDHLSPEQVALVQQEGYSVLRSGRNYLNQMGELNVLVNIPAVGASGAIFGVLMAFGMLFPDQKLFLIFLPVPIAAKYFIPLLMIAELYLGVNNFAWDNVAHFAHLGGALVGFLLIIWYRKFPSKYN